MQQEQIDAAEMDRILNKESGLLGVSGVSSDLRDIENAIAEGNADAKLARDIFIHRAKKYIGSYIAEMNGVDAIVFTAGIGENSIESRSDICAGMEFLGIRLDNEKNTVRGEERAVHADDARVQVWVVPTNEELSIAEDVVKLVETL